LTESPLCSGEIHLGIKHVKKRTEKGNVNRANAFFLNVFTLRNWNEERLVVEIMILGLLQVMIKVMKIIMKIATQAIIQYQNNNH
jgi:hypothetical protein